MPVRFQRSGIFSQPSCPPLRAAHFGPMHATAGLLRRTYTPRSSLALFEPLLHLVLLFTAVCMSTRPGLTFAQHPDPYVIYMKHRFAQRISHVSANPAANPSYDIKTIYQTLAVANCYILLGLLASTQVQIRLNQMRHDQLSSGAGLQCRRPGASVSLRVPSWDSANSSTP